VPSCGRVRSGSIARRDLDALIDRYVGPPCHADPRAPVCPSASTCCIAIAKPATASWIATGAPPELARAILAFVAHEDVPVVGTQVGPRWAASARPQHCHNEMKMTMLREAALP
jgi:phosphatidylglycerophosphatase C